ncbi:hypothetical protein Tco_1272432 [Tanacetum coccineum]
MILYPKKIGLRLREPSNLPYKPQELLIKFDFKGQSTQTESTQVDPTCAKHPLRDLVPGLVSLLLGLLFVVVVCGRSVLDEMGCLDLFQLFEFLQGNLSLCQMTLEGQTNLGGAGVGILLERDDQTSWRRLNGYTLYTIFVSTSLSLSPAEDIPALPFHFNTSDRERTAFCQASSARREPGLPSISTMVLYGTILCKSARRHLSNEAHVTGVSFGQCHIEKVQGQSSLQRNHEQSDDMIVDWVLCFTIMIENNTKQLETDIQEQDKNKATK